MEGPTRWNSRNAIWPVQQASIMLLLLSLVVLVGGLGGVEEVDKTCQSHETCMPNCKLFKVMITYYSKLCHICHYVLCNMYEGKTCSICEREQLFKEGKVEHVRQV